MANKCDLLEKKRQQTFSQQDKILKQFEKINKREFGGYSEMSLKGHLLGEFGKRDGAKYPKNFKTKYIQEDKKRNRIVSQMNKNKCFN